jgi:hypothetical protein
VDPSGSPQIGPISPEVDESGASPAVVPDAWDCREGDFVIDSMLVLIIEMI